MTWIFLMMLAMIGGSIVVELVLPQRTKDRLGTLICSLMMLVTMAFLVLSAVGLVWVAATEYAPRLFS
ncbi:MAG: hypothetical protein ACE5FG_01130 [Myxococcota bacterium]